MKHAFLFHITLADADADPSRCVEALGREGCTDALIGLGRVGFLTMEFEREAATLPSALASAHAAVLRAIPDAALIEMRVSPPTP